jgi:hypothetical protein
LEFDDDCYGLIDWKTNDIDKFKGSGIDKWQLIANFLLANYRYTGNEDNWSKCLFGSVVFYENAYFPRLPLKQEKIDKVKYDRKLHMMSYVVEAHILKNLHFVLFAIEKVNLLLIAIFIVRTLGWQGMGLYLQIMQV